MDREQIKTLVDEIKDSIMCINCGDNYVNYKCMGCNSFGQELNDKVKGLKNKISNIEKDTIKFDVSMARIYSLNILGDTELNSIFHGVDYDKTIENAYNSLMNKVENNVPFVDSDYESLEYFTFDYCNDEEKSFIYDYIIKETLVKNKQFPYDFFENSIKDFTRLKSLPFDKRPRVSIVDYFDIKNRNALVLGNEIQIKKQIVQNMYNGSIEGFETIFHEITHLEQKYRENNYYTSYDDMLAIKEKVLKSSEDDFYEKNHNILSFENEARFYGKLNSIKYLESIGLKVFRKEEILNEAQKELVKKDSETRIFRNREEDINESLDFLLIEEPKYLDKFPKLNLEYIEDDYGVRRKTVDEFVNDYESFDFSPMDPVQIDRVNEYYEKTIAKENNKIKGVTK